MKVVLSSLDTVSSSNWFVALSIVPIFMWMDSSIGNVIMSYHITKKLILRYSLLVMSFAIVPIWIFSNYFEYNWVWGFMMLVLSRSCDRYFLANGKNRYLQIIDLIYPIIILSVYLLGLKISINVLVLSIGFPRLFLTVILIQFINDKHQEKQLDEFVMPRYWLFLIISGLVSLISTNIDTLLLAESAAEVIVFTAISRFFIIFTAISGLSLEIFKEVISQGGDDFYAGIRRLALRITSFTLLVSVIIFFVVLFGVPYMSGITMSAGFVAGVVLLRVITFIPEFIAIYFFTKDSVLEHSVVLLFLGLISILIKMHVTPEIMSFYIINGCIYGVVYFFYFYFKLSNGKLRKT